LIPTAVSWSKVFGSTVEGSAFEEKSLARACSSFEERPFAQALRLAFVGQRLIRTIRPSPSLRFVDGSYHQANNPKTAATPIATPAISPAVRPVRVLSTTIID